MNILFFDENDILKDFAFPQKQELHIWLFPISKRYLLTEDMKVLPVFERDRASAFTHDAEATRYLVSRALLRRLLSAYLGRPATSFIFEKGKHGKPYLSDESIYFNLSHSGDYVALAFCKDSPVGIDIEHTRSNIRKDSLVKRFFHADEAKLFLNLSEQDKEAFLFRRWTVREAFLKGIGSGLTLAPDSFCVEQTSSTVFCITKSQQDYSSWRIVSVPAPGGYYLSAAYIPV